MNRRQLFFTAGSLAAASTLAACTSAPAPSTPTTGTKGGGTLKVFGGAKIGDRLTTPWMASGTLDNVALYRCLFTADHTLRQVTPDLAQSFEYSNNNKTLTIVMKDGLIWSDGQPLTAADVVFSIDTLLKVAQANSIYTAAFKQIVGADALKTNPSTTLKGITADGKTITINLTEPYGSLVPVLAQFAILPQHVLKDANPLELHNNAYFKNPIASGPFRVKEFSTGNFYTMEPNPNFDGDAPKLSLLQFVGSSDLVSDARSGKIDYFNTNIPEVVNGMSAANNFSTNPVDTLFYRYFIFNTTDAESPASKIEFRRALAEAVDYTPLVKALYRDQAIMISSGVPDNDPMSAQLGGFSFNTEKAKQQLTAAGYNFGRQLRLRYYYTDATSRNLMTAVAQGLESIGVKTDVQQFQGDATTELYTNRKWDVALKGLSSFGLEEWYGEYTGANFKAIIGIQPKYDELVAKLASQTGDDARKETLAELQHIERTDLYKLPLFTIRQYIYVAKKVQAAATWGNPFYRYDINLAGWTV